jgi:hypothetical protein
VSPLSYTYWSTTKSADSQPSTSDVPRVRDSMIHWWQLSPNCFSNLAYSRQDMPCNVLKWSDETSRSDMLIVSQAMYSRKTSLTTSEAQGICRVLTGRPLLVAMWMYWTRARVSAKLYLRSSVDYGWEAGTDAIIPVAH